MRKHTIANLLKIYFLLLLLLLVKRDLYAQENITGHWVGHMTRDSSDMRVSFDFRKNNNHLNAYFSSVIQRASGIPLDSVSNPNKIIKFQLMTEPTTYFKGTIKGSAIIGTFRQQGYDEGKIELIRSISPVKNYIQIDTTFNVLSHRISCRIYIPKTGGQCPGVVFMHGSGPEAMFANEYFAEFLASRGIATLISDKEGAGHSTGNWQTASFEDLAEDYISAVRFLKTFRRVNAMQVGIYGHSQGGTISPMVASKSTDIRFVIAAAAVGDTVFKQDLYRVENNLKSNNFSIDDIKAAMTYYKSWLEMARSGQGFQNLRALNEAAKSQKWFDWVEAPPINHWIYKYYLKTGNYNSLEYWGNLKVPILLIYGESDQIEDIHSYLKNITTVIAKKQKQSDFTSIILPFAQHNLTVGPTPNEKFFWWHGSKGYEELVAAWILYRFKNKL